ncbi:response regulator transcription factor [Amycolatopsis sp. NPDC051372]|uniref:response regulator n=1 Tax=Amycolatopsis sp. NPDC051372 TaxID=3155669 RepID=UPI003439838B
MTAQRLILAEDDVLFREGLASLLVHSGFTVMGQVGDATEMLSLARQHRRDLVVVDIRMPPTHTRDGLDAAQMIRQELPGTGVLVLSAHIEAERADPMQGSRTGCGSPKERWRSTSTLYWPN